MKSFIVFLSVLLLPLTTYANETFLEKSEFGLYGGANFNFHTPNFNYADSLLFDNNNTTFHMHFGALYNYKINEMFTLSGRLGYNGLSTNLVASDDLSTEMDASLSYIEFSPLLNVYNLLPVDKLYLIGGLEFAFPISATTEISNVTEDIPDISPRIALALGLGYKFEIADNVYLSPEVDFRFPFGDISTHSDFNSWNTPQLRLGVALSFGFGKPKPSTKVEGLEAGFRDVYYLDRNGEKNSLKRITVEQQNYGELFPIIPYVFFEKGSKVPSEKSQDLNMQIETGGFLIDDLSPDATAINKHTLDIIGSRMQDNPNTKIELTGTVADEDNNMKLAQDRADFVKDYLKMNYSISDSRIVSKSAASPSKPSSNRVQDGIEENRRVEISADKELLKPIMIDKENRNIPSPDIIVFEPYAETNLPISKWELFLFQADRELEKYEGIGSPSIVSWNIKPNQLEASNIPVDYVLSVNTRDGKEASVTGSIPVDFLSKSRMQSEKRANKTITKFSLVVFGFDSPTVSEHDKEIITKHIIPEIKYNSTVQIYGYTDRIGSESYNRKLALQRAENVMQFLKSKKSDVKYEVFGVGENVEIYDNNNPIGRQLSRTVQVYVITPDE